MKTVYFLGNLQMPSMPGDVGYNLPSSENHFWIDCQGDVVSIRTGIRMRLNENVYARIVTRSSAADKGFHVLEGTIDCGYTGELFIRAIVMKSRVSIGVGESIAQVIFTPVVHPLLENVTHVPEKSNPIHCARTHRGTRGFGSTDMPKESFGINPQPEHNHD
jgi:dUTPase